VPGKRRRNNEGCIGKRRSDGRIPGYVSLSTGGRKWVYGRSEREVRQKIRALIRDQEQGMQPPARLKLAAYLQDQWLDAKRRKLGNGALRYEELIRLHIAPRVGNRWLDSLRPLDVQKLYADLEDGGLSTATVLKVHTVMHGALRQAVKWGLVGRNVAEAVEPPRPVETEKRALTSEQIKALLAAAAGDRLEALYWIAIGTGLRQGELFALRWSDVDLEAGTLQVQRKVRRVGKLGLQEGQPKSRKGRRGMTLPGIVATALGRHLDRQQAEAATHGASWNPFKLVFCTEDGRQIDASVYRKWSWYPLRKRAELPTDPPVDFHELRHTNGSLLIALGIDVKTVQQRLGHAHAQVTLDVYAHVMPGVADDAAAQLDRFLRNVAPDETVVKTVVNQPDDNGEAAPEGRPPYLVEGGAPKGIRTPDLRLERAAS
jgi:integrase